MVKNQLPVWYTLQEMDGVDFQISNYKEIEELVEHRLDILSDTNKQEFKKDILESEEEFRDRIVRDRKGFTLLKMGVALDPKLSTWLTEVEGDLFEYRFMKTGWKQKKLILHDLFAVDNGVPTWLELDNLSGILGENLKEVLTLPDQDIIESIRAQRIGIDLLSSQSGIANYIGIDFRYAPFLVKTRRSRLYKGWIIDTIDRLSSTIKKRFEALLSDQLEQYGERIETQASGPIKRLSNRLNEKLRTLVRTRKEYNFSNFKLSGTYEDHMKLYPPCIQDLLRTVNNVGYIPHWERFQLGLFLKHTGMPVDDQLEFWFNKAVDNINISFEEFKKRAGYVIRHIYGLEGAKIDYDMPSCSTIQTKMYCTFRHQGIDNVVERIKDEMKALDGHQQQVKSEIAKKISEHTANGYPSSACAKHLELVTNRVVSKVYHPLQYLQIAAESKKLLVDKRDEKGEEEIDD